MQIRTRLIGGQLELGKRRRQIHSEPHPKRRKGRARIGARTGWQGYWVEDQTLLPKAPLDRTGHVLHGALRLLHLAFSLEPFVSGGLADSVLDPLRQPCCRRPSLINHLAHAKSPVDARKAALAMQSCCLPAVTPDTDCGSITIRGRDGYFPGSLQRALPSMADQNARDVFPHPGRCMAGGD